jgi:hypothetical protein
MRAISLWQPWATLWVSGMKEYETRHWTHNYRGFLAVHAAKKKPDVDTCIDFDLDPKTLPLGAVIGIVNLLEVIPMTDELIRSISKQEFSAGDWCVGRFAWKAKPVNKFPNPFPCLGHQGFWNWDRMAVTL